MRRASPGTAARRAPRAPRTLGLLAVIAATLSFAISLSVVKWPGVPGSVIAWWRLIGSSLLWWAFLVVRRHRTGRSLPTLEAWKLATPPALCFGLNISLFFLALTRTSVAHADFISSMSPLILIPAGFVFFGEQPRWRALRWGGLERDRPRDHSLGRIRHRRGNRRRRPARGRRRDRLRRLSAARQAHPRTAASSRSISWRS